MLCGLQHGGRADEETPRKHAKCGERQRRPTRRIGALAMVCVCRLREAHACCKLAAEMCSQFNLAAELAQHARAQVIKRRRGRLRRSGMTRKPSSGRPEAKGPCLAQKSPRYGTVACTRSCRRHRFSCLLSNGLRNRSEQSGPAAAASRARRRSLTRGQPETSPDRVGTSGPHPRTARRRVGLERGLWLRIVDESTPVGRLGRRGHRQRQPHRSWSWSWR